MPGHVFVPSLLALALIAALGALLDVMEVDAAQYASMSRDMLAQDDWLELYHRNADYLDKPPLLFWLSALSFKVFGVHNWSYKLPSILFAFLGMFSTYRFTWLFHTEEVARTAALVFGGSAAFVLMVNDVRCDTILTGSVVMAIWLGMAWVEQRRWWRLAGCATAIAAGMLAKGPIGLMAPLLAIGGHVLLARRWDVLRDPRLVAGAAIVALLLLPMCIGLYQQHGTHGLRFYFWEQSFGRITGENRWKDDSTVLFFTHELVWQMLPWTVFALLGTWRAIATVLKGRALPEYASISGAVLVFIALSLSRFKLPHYLYVALPLFAVLAARAWHDARPRWTEGLHLLLLALVWAVAVLLTGWSFPEGNGAFLLLLASVAVVAVLLVRRRALFAATFWTMAAIAATLNGHLYPVLLGYQANAHAGRWAVEQGLDATRFFGMRVSGTALDFYAGFPVPWLSHAEEARAVVVPGVAIYTDAEGLRELLDAGLVPVERITLEDYRVQLLDLQMLLPDRRAEVLEERWLLRY